MTGVIRRATNSEKKTETATVRPNWMKYCPECPHEGHPHEDRDDREGGGDDRQADLVRRLDGRAVGRFAHLDVARDVLDLDDRVVDENAGCPASGQEGNEVEREAEQVP